jgi:hypothetical protein
MMAAPMPWTARDALSIVMSWAAAQRPEAAVNSATPMPNSRRRPKRSASEPAVRTTVASARV